MEISIIDTVASFISVVGFPIAVSVFVLWKLNGKLGKLTDSVLALDKTIAVLLEHLKHTYEDKRN